MLNKKLQTIDYATWDLAPEIQQNLEQLLNHIEVITTELREVKNANQQLRDEIARLKGGPGKPDLKPNRAANQKAAPAGEEDQKQARKRKRQSGKNAKKRKPRNARINIDREEIVRVNRRTVPADVIVHSYRRVTIQNVKFTTDNVLYRLEKLYAPSTGKYYAAALPAKLTGQLYGSDLEALVLMFYFQLRVTENKIWQLLQSIGLVISAGQISNIIIKKHVAKFAAERHAIIQAGLETSAYHQIDDTGTRENGINQHTFALGNQFYSSFFTKRYKNQATVKKLLAFLEKSAESPESPKELQAFIKILSADDAPQFHDITPYRGLCWWHEVRLFEKLQPVFDYHQKILDAFIGKIWDYYDRLVAYKSSPTEKFKAELAAEFDALFATSTGYEQLDHRIGLTGKKSPTSCWFWIIRKSL